MFDDVMINQEIELALGANALNAERSGLSQIRAVLRALGDCKTIDRDQALFDGLPEWGCGRVRRLAACIHLIRDKMGYDIETIYDHSTKKCGYRMRLPQG